MRTQVLVSLFMLFCVSSATIGVDISDYVDNFACFKQHGISFVITRAYCSFGGVDTDAPYNLQNIKAAGLIGDVYFFPCGSIPAATQVNQMVDYLSQHNNGLLSTEQQQPQQQGMRAGFEGHEYMESIVRKANEERRFLETEEVPGSSYQPFQATNDQYGTVWIDVETNPSSGCSWDNYSYQSNCQFLGDIVKAFQARGKRVGIYSSYYMWEGIFGSADACPNFTNIDLWYIKYAHYDGVASFSDWNSMRFGGWTRPAMKQYAGDTTLCGAGVDYNFY